MKTNAKNQKAIDVTIGECIIATSSALAIAAASSVSMELGIAVAALSAMPLLGPAYKIARLAVKAAWATTKLAWRWRRVTVPAAISMAVMAAWGVPGAGLVAKVARIAGHKLMS